MTIDALPFFQDRKLGNCELNNENKEVFRIVMI